MPKPKSVLVALLLLNLVLGGIAGADPLDVPKIKKFLKKRKACIFAFGNIVKAPYITSEGLVCSDSAGDLFMSCHPGATANVMCIFNATKDTTYRSRNLGGIDATTGCTVAWYSLRKNKYGPLIPWHTFIQFSEPCSKNLVRKILTRPYSTWGSIPPKTEHLPNGRIRFAPPPRLLTKITFSMKAPYLDLEKGLYLGAVSLLTAPPVSGSTEVVILADKYKLGKELQKLKDKHDKGNDAQKYIIDADLMDTVNNP